MNKRWDVQSIFEIGKMVVWILLLAVAVTEALNLMSGIIGLSFPQKTEELQAAFNEDLGSILANILYGIGSVVMFILAHRYFKKVCQVGTPFTYAGARDVKRMAIVCAIANGAALVGCYVIDIAMDGITHVPEDKLTNYGGLVLAAVLFVVSYILDHGAKLEEKNEQYKDRIAQLHKQSKE